MAGSPEPRRKRKRTARAQAGFKGCNVNKTKYWCPRVSLPCFALMFGLVMSATVFVQKTLRRRRKKVAELRLGISTPLAILLQGQYEIDSQAARFADPLEVCLSGDDDLSGRLGPFTCVADAVFFLWALAVALDCPDLLVIDVGSPSPRMSGMDPQGKELSLPGTLHIQKRVKVGVDPLPDKASLVLVDAHEGLSSDAWSVLILSTMEVVTAGGAIAIRGPREGNGEQRQNGVWSGRADMIQAVVALSCGETSLSSAVGNFDGGIVIVRHAVADETRIERGCGNTDGKASGTDGTAEASPRQLIFENLFLWARRETGTAETVQAKFGGEKYIRRYARRRSSRSACMKKITGRSTTTKTPTEQLEEHSGSRLRTKGHKGSVSNTTPEQAARACLEVHLKEHQQDVRAAFALAMLLQATGSSDVDRQMARLRKKVLTESGRAGVSLWRSLHARAADALVAELRI